jgi:hypothetical protein
VRARPREGDGVQALAAQLRVVPAAAQVGSLVVVRGERHPGGPRRAVRALGEVDRDQLPVGLVVVDAAELRPPVVHGVEEPVLQADVAALAHHAPVVREAVGLEVLAVGDLRSGGEARPHGAPQQQGAAERRIDEASQHPGGGEPGARGEPCPGLAPPAAQGGAGERSVDEAQRQRPARVRGARLAQPLQVEAAGGHHAARAAARLDRPEAAPGHVRLHGGREEQLAVRVPHDGLVGAQEGEVAVRGRLHRVGEPTARPLRWQNRARC